MHRLYLPNYKTVVVFMTATLILCIFYRISFFFISLKNPIEDPAFLFTILSLGIISDFTACFVMSVPLLGLNYLLLRQTSEKTMARVIGMLIINGLSLLLFLMMTLIYLINQKTLNDIYIGLNYILVSSYLKQGFNALQLYSFATINDYLFAIIMIAIYLKLFYSSAKTIARLLTFIILPFVFLLALYGSVTFLYLNIGRPSSRFMALYTSPINQITLSYFKSFNRFNNPRIAIDAKQLNSIKLIDPIFTRNDKPTPSGITLPAPQNIVIFVLESVSSEYIFKNIDNKVPMPFLKALAPQSLWFQNHYATGNISALSQFGILTGLYPNPTPSHFEMQANLNIPTLATWLGQKYDSFLISASNNLYFSMGLNKTFSQYINAYTISPDMQNLYFSMFLDETVALNYFLNRLEHARKPFLAVYWSGAAHYPYKDYENFHSLIKQPKLPLDRYLNNLVLLDAGIKKTFALLQQKNMLDQTLFIVIGDHGELFGQHDGLEVHGRSLFQEEIKVPLLIYSPHLPARVFSHLTSSIDLVPTLLHLLNLPIKERFQGENLLNIKPARKYIFVYSDQDEIAAIGQDQIKMKISFAEGKCTAYDLKNDPKEQQPLPCNNQAQQEAILQFRNFQPRMLLRYNLAADAADKT